MSLMAVGLLLGLVGVAILGLVTDTRIAQDPESGHWGIETSAVEDPIRRRRLRRFAWTLIVLGFGLQFVAEVWLG